MTRTKATVKRRQQRRRLEKEAQQAQLREARESELQQHPGEEEEEEASEPAIALQQNAVVEEEKDDDEEEELIRAQNDDALEQEDKEEEREREKHPEGEEEGDGDDDEGQLLLTDYEKQRERRMKENAAKLAALNLPSLALPFGPSRRPQRQSTVRRNKKDDDDYMPSSSSGSDSDDNAEENAGPLHQQDDNGDYDEDRALQQAIALSLTASADNVTETKRRQTCKGKRQVSDPNDSAKKKRKGRQQQFTSDEIVAIFAIIDGMFQDPRKGLAFFEISFGMVGLLVFALKIKTKTGEYVPFLHKKLQTNSHYN
eukprot:c21797_g1_i4 orf=2-937(-)